jgi:hypothetical protein
MNTRFASLGKVLMLSVIALVLFVVPVTVPIATVRGQQTVPVFAVSVSGQSLTAGFNNTVVILLSNNYSSTVYGPGSIYAADIAISLPTPLNLVGDNHWHYDSIAFGQTVTITCGVYAPTSAIGSSYQATITATYRQLGDISTTQETHVISFTVYGWISMIIYGVQMTPSSVEPGGNATISGNVLNTGNLAAYNATVTVQSDIVEPTPSPSAFVGEVDPNIPRPFSVLVVFSPNLANGNYSLTVRLSVIDTSRPGVPITKQLATQIQIKKPTQQQFTRQQPTGPIDVIYQILRELYNVFIGSLTGILSPLEWQITPDSHS